MSASVISKSVVTDCSPRRSPMVREQTTSSATPQRPVFKLELPCVGPSASHTEQAGF